MNNDLKTLIDGKISGYLSFKSKYTAKLYEAMNYTISDGGKRIRPILLIEFCKLFGGDLKHALPFACALEMIHSYSLIHDDLPCMDNDDMRHGKASNHIVFGESTALLAGDGLLTMAFKTVLSSETIALVGSEKAAEAASVLSECAMEMVDGQSIDLMTEGKSVSVEELESMYMGKTVALIKAACLIGAITAGADEEQISAAEKYAIGIGMAFQIKDDILDVTSSAEKLGKNIGIDSQNDKRNFVTMFGVERSEKYVKTYTESAKSAICVYKGSEDLVAFADKLAQRDR